MCASVSQTAHGAQSESHRCRVILVVAVVVVVDNSNITHMFESVCLYTHTFCVYYIVTIHIVDVHILRINVCIHGR